eukprot:1379130-Amorphochlora_amoeboformis.AAC.1
MELTGAELEHKPLCKLFPDFSSKDFFVLVYKKSLKRKHDRTSLKGQSKKVKASRASYSFEKLRQSAVRSGGLPSESKSGASQGVRNFLRKIGERRRAAARQVEPKEDLLAQLTNMGFKQEAATRALLLHRNNLELSLNWLLENSSDPAINKPITSRERQQLSRVASRPAIPMEALSDFIDINFGRGQGLPEDSVSGIRSGEEGSEVEDHVALSSSQRSPAMPASGTDSDDA